MHNKLRLLALVSIFLVLSAVTASSSAAAQTTEPISVAEFREKFTEYAAWLDSLTPQTDSLAMKVRAMSDEEFQALYDSFADPDAFIALTEQIMQPALQAQSMQAPNFLAPQEAELATGLFTPAYPDGWDYRNWTHTLPELGLLSDSNGDGSLTDERCSANGESQIALAADIVQVAAIVGDVACESIVVILGAGTNLPFCIAAGVLHETVHSTEIAGHQCSMQDGLVDSAEIEAVYENSRYISGQLDGVATQLGIHDTDIKAILAANQAQVLKIEIEKALADTNDNKRLSYFYLPEAQGGMLELVRQTVFDAIQANEAAGISTGNSASWFAKAEASFAGGDYKSAYDQYSKAYLEVVK